MIRRPPSSTLFPYPPLSRPSGQGPARGRAKAAQIHAAGIPAERAPLADPARPLRLPGAQARLSDLPDPRLVRIQAEDQARSEEHTSELQSRLHLVCRLLLEK